MGRQDLGKSPSSASSVSKEKREQIVFKADGFLPFVDRFGQFKHADWPGKVHDERDLKQANEDPCLQAVANSVMFGRHFTRRI